MSNTAMSPAQPHARVRLSGADLAGMVRACDLVLPSAAWVYLYGSRTDLA
jgi:hypothetical protein